MFSVHPTRQQDGAVSCIGPSDSALKVLSVKCLNRLRGPKPLQDAARSEPPGASPAGSLAGGAEGREAAALFAAVQAVVAIGSAPV